METARSLNLSEIAVPYLRCNLMSGNQQQERDEFQREVGWRIEKKVVAVMLGQHTTIFVAWK